MVIDSLKYHWSSVYSRIIQNHLQVGIIHAISKLQRDIPNLNLAVSLHAPVQDIRCRIMPAARAFPLDRLMNTLREYQTSRSHFSRRFFLKLHSHYFPDNDLPYHK